MKSNTVENLVGLVCAICIMATCAGATTINPIHKYAYGANVGWVNFAADGANGAVMGEYVCSGYLYGANIGWIHIGDGAPENGHQYANDSATDYGVNHAGLGKLRGYAYGANVGWINFEDQGNPVCDLTTGKMSGYAYGANIGWIGLSNLHAYVQTDSMVAGTSGDGDTIDDPWEYGYTNDLGVLYDSHDADGDGVLDEDEATADSNPFDSNDFLRITSIAPNSETNATLSWASQPTRYYRVDHNPFLTNPAGWTDSGLGQQLPDTGPSTTRTVPGGAVTQHFYRVKAIVPELP